MHFVTTVDRHFTTAPTGRPWLATCPPSHFASSSSLSLWPSSSSCPAFAKRWVVHVYSQTAPILAAVESLIAWLTILSERQETFTRSCSSYLPEPTPDECQWFRNRNLQSCRIASARTTSFFIRVTVDIQKRERIYTQHLFFFYFHFFFSVLPHSPPSPSASSSAPFFSVSLITIFGSLPTLAYTKPLLLLLLFSLRRAIGLSESVHLN